MSDHWQELEKTIAEGNEALAKERGGTASPGDAITSATGGEGRKAKVAPHWAALERVLDAARKGGPQPDLDAEPESITPIADVTEQLATAFGQPLTPAKKAEIEDQRHAERVAAVNRMEMEHRAKRERAVSDMVARNSIRKSVVTDGRPMSAEAMAKSAAAAAEQEGRDPVLAHRTALVAGLRAEGDHAVADSLERRWRSQG